MGAVFAVLIPGVPMPVSRLRGELFARYGLDWQLGRPPEESAPGTERPVPARQLAAPQLLAPHGLPEPQAPPQPYEVLRQAKPPASPPRRPSAN